MTSEANLGKAKIDVETQKAEVKVSEADERKAAAMLAYTQITAPYDGVVTVRNANTGDYVQAVTGDKSSQNPSAIFVVARTDIVRIFLDVPEAYARYVQKGTEAVVRAEALSGLQIPAKVTRTSWAIREKTRTLMDGNRSLGQRVRRIAAGHVRLHKSARPATRRLRFTAEGANGGGQSNLLLSPAKQQGRQDSGRGGH